MRFTRQPWPASSPRAVVGRSSVPRPPQPVPRPPLGPLTRPPRLTKAWRLAAVSQPPSRAPKWLRYRGTLRQRRSTILADARRTRRWRAVSATDHPAGRVGWGGARPSRSPAKRGHRLASQQKLLWRYLRAGSTMCGARSPAGEAIARSLRHFVKLRSGGCGSNNARSSCWTAVRKAVAARRSAGEDTPDANVAP